MDRRRAPLLLILLLALGLAVAWLVLGNRQRVNIAENTVAAGPCAAPPRDNKPASNAGLVESKPTPGKPIEIERPAPPPADDKKDNAETRAPETPGAPPEADKPQPVLLQGSRISGAVRLTLKFHITVQDDLGHPVADAEVYASASGMADVGEVPEGMSVSPAQEFYDDTLIGRSNAFGVLEVEIGLRAEFEAFTVVWGDVHARKGLSVSPKVKFDRDRNRAQYDITVTLPPRGGLRGRVVDRAGVGVDQMGVWADWKDKPKDQWAYAFTDAAGNFELQNLPPGEVTLTVRGDTYRGVNEKTIATVYPFTVTGLDADIVAVPRTHYVLKLLPPEGGKNAPLTAVYKTPGGDVTRTDVVWFNNYAVLLYDPPAGATAVELRNNACLPLLVALPGLAADEMKDLGEYRMLAAPATDE